MRPARATRGTNATAMVERLARRRAAPHGVTSGLDEATLSRKSPTKDYCSAEPGEE